MRFVIDVDLDENGRIVAEHIIETDRRPDNKVVSPQTGQFIDVIDLVVYLSQNPQAMNAAGFAVQTKAAAGGNVRTRWQYFVDQVNALPATDPLRALGLK